MKKNNHKNLCLNEDGVALIMVAGVLAVMFLLGIAFTTKSIISKKTSDNYIALQSARLGAQSALNRTLATLNNYVKDNQYDLTKIYSYNDDSVSNTVKSEQLSELMETIVEGITYHKTENYDIGEGPHWQYLYGNSGLNSSIIVRFAYAIVADMGKFNPSAALDSGYNAYSLGGMNVAATESNSSSGADGTERTSLKSDGSFVVGRPGRDTNEIFLRTVSENSDSGNWFTNNDAIKISSYFASPAGKMKEDSTGWTSQWLDFQTLFDSLSINDDLTKNLFQTYFILGNEPDPEAFWIDNGDYIKENSELYNRFNLARTDWNDTSKININAFIVASSDKYSDGVDSDMYLPWLQNWKDTGDFAGYEQSKKQIIANLIDYCDNDRGATTDNEDTPFYTGNDKSVYLNELEIKFTSNSQFYSPGDLLANKVNAQVVPENLIIEVVNLYDVVADPSDYYGITAEVTMDWQYSIAQKTVIRQAHKANVDILNVNSVGNRYKISSYYNFENGDWLYSNYENGTWFDTDSSQTESGIKDLKITSLRVKLKDKNSSILYDYSYLVDSDLYVTSESGDTFLIADSSYASDSSVIVAQVATDTGFTEGPTENYFLAEVDDPRQNLLISDWIINTGESVSSTLGSKNMACNINSTIDADSEIGATEPWEVSTAYIRNSSMFSPWELGFIHRAKKWQTLNLKKYNAEEGMYPSSGGGVYLAGDANILDQVKMTELISVLNKVNLNTPYEEILKILFQKIRIGSNDNVDTTYYFNNYDEPGRLSNYEVNSPNATSLAQAILTLTGSGTDSSNMVNTRAEILADEAILNSLVYGNITEPALDRNKDAMQEELVGKFINLTKASQSANSYVVIVVAQAIKDLGHPLGSNGFNFYNSDGNKDGIFSDVFNAKVGTYDSDADIVLSTQKLVAVIKRKPATNRFWIDLMYYVND